MKKVFALTLAFVLALVSFTGIAQAEEGPVFVTVREWLDAKGECGDCLLLLKIVEEVNPVVAIAGDETGFVNLWSGANEESSFITFMNGTDESKLGYVLVIANPKYNLYEDTIEMAEWTLVRMLPALV